MRANGKYCLVSTRFFFHVFLGFFLPLDFLLLRYAILGECCNVSCIYCTACRTDVSGWRITGGRGGSRSPCGLLSLRWFSVQNLARSAFCGIKKWKQKDWVYCSAVEYWSLNRYVEHQQSVCSTFMAEAARIKLCGENWKAAEDSWNKGFLTHLWRSLSWRAFQSSKQPNIRFYIEGTALPWEGGEGRHRWNLAYFI